MRRVSLSRVRSRVLGVSQVPVVGITSAPKESSALNLSKESFAVNQVSQPPAAGKLTTRWSPYACCVAGITALLVSLVCVGFFIASPASADSARKLVGKPFGGPGEGAGELDLASPVLENLEIPGFVIGGSGVAVDEATGDVYVADTGNRRVDEFEGDGSFVRAWGWGVANGEGKLEVCSATCRRGLSGGGAGELAAPRFIAVDNSGGASEGDVYVGDGVGSEAKNETQFVEFNGASGGTFTLSYEGHATGAIPFTRKEGSDGPNAVKALEAATGKHGVFIVKEHLNSQAEVVALEVEFVGSLAESVTEMVGCAGAGLVPEGTSCEVLLDREGSRFAGDVVSKFSGDGVLEASWGSGGQLDGSAAPAGAFVGDLNGLTVDAAGVLWVYDEAEMYGFEADGGFARDCRVGFGSASGLAPGASPGEVYSVGAFQPKVERHTHLCEGGETGQVVGDYSPVTPTGLAGDGGGGVLVDLGASVVDLPPGVSEPPSFGPVAGGLGLGVNGEGGVFVASASEDKLDFFGVSLSAETLAASGVTAGSATLNGEVNAKGTEVVSCVFEYGESETYGRRVPCEPAGPITGSGKIEVHVPVTGLTPGTVYHYRLRLVNKDGEALDTKDEQLATTVAGVVEESATVNVEPTSARLTAKVNPKGVGDTRCRIEYGSSSYEASAACEPKEVLASEDRQMTVGLVLEGLTAGVTYRWRVVLSDEHDASIDGPAETFVYLARDAPPVVAACPGEEEALRGESDSDPVTGRAFSSELPDCRAYEMVTPVAKDAALLSPVFDGEAAQVGTEGTRVVTPSLQCFAQSQSCPAARGEYGSAFAFSRGEAGWTATGLEPPASVYEEDSNLGASAQTGMALFSAPLAGQVPDTFYARQPDGATEAIGPVSEALPFEEVKGLESVATADLSHVVFWDLNKEGLWPSLLGRGLPLYEYAGAGNSQPFLVDVEGGEHSTKTIGDCRNLAELGSRGTRAWLYALSADGSIVYFEACPQGEEDGAPGAGLYARVDGEDPDARTVLVSARASGTGAGPDECSGACASSPAAGALLQGASEDGTRVFFSSAQQLTNDASEASNNLYLYEDPQEQGGGRLVDVSAGDVSGLGPGVQGVMSVSADGSHVYFVAKGVLTGANTEGAQPTEDADNLYMYERDTAYPQGRTAFVATLPGDKTIGPSEVPETEQWHVHLKAANVTPDGDFLLFTSHGALTGDDSRGLGPEQVYRYDALTGGLARVSIGEHGFDDDGNAGTGSAWIVAPNSKIGQPRRDPSISDDGSVVFFQSPVGLTARALNDVALNGVADGYDQAQNIYEWEAPGARGCGEGAGCVYLISDGQDASEEGGSAGATESSVELLGTDASGGDVFFTTADRLVPADTDSELDIYDARVDGGFPAPRPPASCTSSETCHEEGTSPGFEPSLGSSIFTGPGNLGTSPFKVPPTIVKKTAAQLRAEKLAKALKLCKKDKKKSTRQKCEKQARKKYSLIKASKSKPKKKKRNR